MPSTPYLGLNVAPDKLKVTVNPCFVRDLARSCNILVRVDCLEVPVRERIRNRCVAAGVPDGLGPEPVRSRHPPVSTPRRPDRHTAAPLPSPTLTLRRHGCPFGVIVSPACRRDAPPWPRLGRAHLSPAAHYV